MLISQNTIATIEHIDGLYLLTLYRNKKVIFSKTYRTYNGAAIAQTKLLKKYDLVKKYDLA